MKKSVTTLILALLCTFGLYAQGEIVDTIEVVTFEDFKVPQGRQIIFTNIMDIDFQPRLLDENFNEIRTITTGNQFPPSINASDRGVTVQYSLTESIKKAGNYIVQIRVNYRDEIGNKNATANYFVKVDNPTIASKTELYDKYYPSEQEAFSFATAEFTNPTLYSYHIEDAGGTIVDSGRGSVVELDNILSNDNYIARSFKVVGKYKDEVFSYKEIDDPSTVKESVWEFTLSQPLLNEYVNWWNSENEQQKPENVYISPLNPFLLRFLYVYTGLSGEGNLVVIPPKIQNLRIQSQPADFLNTGRGGSATIQGNFGYVYLDINQTFLDNMEFCDDMTITLTVQFNTQFERNIQKEYTATIIK